MRLLISILWLIPSIGHSQSIFDDFDSFLEDHVVFGSVDYRAIKNNPKALDDLIVKIAAYDLEDTSEDFEKAFYINAYNVLVIEQVTENYPLKSPLDIEGFFKGTKFSVAGDSLSLDQLEFDRLLNKTKDPRIHFSLACAAKGCPYLYESAFYPEGLNEQLDFRAKQIVELSNYVFVDNKKETVTLSKIFDWYEDQFLWASESLIDFINQYRKSKIPADYTIEFTEYNWTLNDR